MGSAWKQLHAGGFGRFASITLAVMWESFSFSLLVIYGIALGWIIGRKNRVQRCPIRHSLPPSERSIRNRGRSPHRLKLLPSKRAFLFSILEDVDGIANAN
jgi:hypothetical protein